MIVATGSIAGDRLRGELALAGYVSRRSFPELSSPALRFSLDTTKTSVEGVIEASHLEVDGAWYEFRARYDLYKDSPSDPAWRGRAPVRWP